MELGETLRVESLQAWREWLITHHADQREVWLVNDRKGPHRRTPDYEDLLDEATCYGWVDVLVRGLDERRYLTRWVPRRRTANWTATNRERARRLAGEGRIADAGLASLPDDLRAELTT